jgi:hypothetical protein
VVVCSRLLQRQYLELAEGWLKLALQLEQLQRDFKEGEE